MNLHSSRYTESFWQALVTLGDHHVERDHAARVLAFWSDLSRELLSEPDLSEADGAVRFTWCGDRYTLQVDVHPDGRISWYFRDASLPPGQSEGESEQRPGGAPGAVLGVRAGSQAPPSRRLAHVALTMQRHRAPVPVPSQ